MNDEQDIYIEQMLLELKEYIDRLNVTLQNGCNDEMCNIKEQYKEVIVLAGELNDYLAK